MTGPDDISEALYKCAALRGLPKQLIHRTMHEFDWFVTEMIFENTRQKIKDPERYDSMYTVHIEYGYGPLEAWIAAFHQYCIDEYGDINNG